MASPAFTGKMTDSVTGVTHASQVCASLSSYTYSELTGEYVGLPTFEAGCRVDVPACTIRIDAKLKSATLAPIHLTVQDEACDKFGCDPGAGVDIVAVAEKLDRLRSADELEGPRVVERRHLPHERIVQGLVPAGHGPRLARRPASRRGRLLTSRRASPRSGRAARRSEPSAPGSAPAGPVAAAAGPGRRPGPTASASGSANWLW